MAAHFHDKLLVSEIIILELKGLITETRISFSNEKYVQ